MKMKINESDRPVTYVVFRKYYNEYTDSWEPIAFYWAEDIPTIYGRVNIIKQDGIVPYRNTPRYVHDDANVNYFVKTKALTSNDESYDEFTEFVVNEFNEDNSNVIERQKIDRNAIRNSWIR